MLLPREKLLLQGPSALEDHELLAIVLGRGTSRENIFELSKRLLKGFEREVLFYEKDVKILEKNLGLGPVQAGQIIAAMELGRRFFSQKNSTKQLHTLDDVYSIVKDMEFLHKEYVRALYCNSRFRIIHDEIISIGSLDANIIHPREIFRPAIEFGAYALILVHNHPSGDPTPSPADREVTHQLMTVSEMMQIPLLDHVIVGVKGFFSLGKNQFVGKIPGEG